MCEWSTDYYPCSVWNTRERTARKNHRCGGCQTIIHKGEKYTYVSGVHDGSGFSEKWCNKCWEAARIFGQKHRGGVSQYDLIEALRYCVEEDGPTSWAKPHLEALEARWDAAPDKVL